MTYVIQSTDNLPRKDGTTWTDISYFREHSMIFNCMESSIEKAKHYEWKMEAVRDKRKYFGLSKNVKIVKV